MAQIDREQSAAGQPQAQQLILGLDHREALDREKFLVAPCNEDAVAAVDRWPDWRAQTMALVGPASAGKSHLAQVWRQCSGALLVSANELVVARLPELLESRALVIENGEKISNEEALLHLINLVDQEGSHLLLTSRTPPGRWNIGLADLQSRLQTIPTITLGRPCDTLLKGVLRKLFDDRQLVVSADITDYLIARMERSLESAHTIVQLIDQDSMVQKRKVSRKLVGEILDRLEDEDKA